MNTKSAEGTKSYKFPIGSFFRFLSVLELLSSKVCVSDGISVSLRFNDLQVDFSLEICTALEILPKTNL